ncbi:MAG TPA: EamA family transporter, partial [Acidimicrobiia bacterium]|nr:EamA family transporter [Acidimicrobiia bacterium]
MNRDRMRAVMLAVPVLWGVVFIGVERVLRQLDAFQLVAIRFTMISALFGLLMVFTPSLRPRLDRRGWLSIAAISVLGVPAAQLTVV